MSKTFSIEISRNKVIYEAITIMHFNWAQFHIN